MEVEALTEVAALSSFITCSQTSSLGSLVVALCVIGTSFLTLSLGSSKHEEEDEDDEDG